MKTKLLLSILFTTILLSCSSKKNEQDFITKTTGRYFFNADEIIEVSFKDQELYLLWRGAEIKPLKINDSVFYARALNEKLIFSANGDKIVLAEKKQHKGKKYTFTKLKKGEKTPSEYIDENNFELALKGYQTIQQKDSLNPIIRERTLNRIGYQYLRNDELEKAVLVFKINTKLYPKSSNTFDSLGDAYLEMKDSTNAIESYKKALEINPENRSSKRNLQKITEKK